MKSNKLIAKFMGLDSFKDSLASLHQGKINVDVDVYEQAQYHLSWDWLMPVVKKIEDMGCEIVITNGECTISGSNDYYEETIGKSRRGSTYQAVVEFINEHNKNK